MREEIINILAQALHNNIGQRLTDELATGIATVVNRGAMQIEQAAAPSNPAPAPDAQA